MLFASGRAPTRPGQVAINSAAATKGKLTTGERAKVVLPNAGVVDVTVVGVYKSDVETGGYIGVLFSQQQALALFTDGTHVGSLDISADPGVSENTLAAHVARTLSSTLEVRTGTQARADDQGGIQTALSFINYILLAFGFIALIVGTFIIYNTFSMIVAQRLRELALLRAIGAGRRQVRRSVLVEAGIIGVIGSALGLAGGIGLAYRLRALLDAVDLGLPSGGLVITPRHAPSSLRCSSARASPCSRPTHPHAGLRGCRRWRRCERSTPRRAPAACAGARCSAPSSSLSARWPPSAA